MTTKTLEQIARLSNVLANADTLELLLAELLDAAVHLCEADAGRVYTLDETHTYLKVLVSQNRQASHEPEPLALDLKADPYNAPIPVYSATFGQAVNVQDVTSGHGYNQDYLQHYQQQIDYPINSLLVAPLVNPQEQTIGVIELFNCQAEDGMGFDHARESLLHSLCQIGMAVTNSVLKQQILNTENRQLKYQVAQAQADLIVGQTEAMQQAVTLAEKVARKNINVLITGETGVGKDVLARYIHRLSPRDQKPFVVQNCAALPAELLEAELFGYRAGAFTGAKHNHAGLFAAANGGTLMLDEIGDMPHTLQAKLLRVLQEGLIKPLGSESEVPVNVRVLAATHQDLPQAIERGDFRADLYHRLNGFSIVLPPLRERKTDLRDLVGCFIQEAHTKNRLPVATLLPEAYQALQGYTYPGNLRELRSIVNRFLLLAEGQDVTASLVQQAIQVGSIEAATGNDENQVKLDLSEATAADDSASTLETLKTYGLKATLQQLEAQLIQQAIEYNQGKMQTTAKLLQMAERTLRERKAKLGL